ncbi:hypothetical protein EGD80_18095 [Bacillus subtilis]|nr:hypothetical protein CAH07_17590 [Bacillus subtilis]ROT25962.1 hypothetical protein EGD80_18095 [Bacillus subtilis]
MKIQDEEYRLIIKDNSNQLAKLNKEKLKLEKGLLQQKQTIDFTKLIQQLNGFFKTLFMTKKFFIN